MNFVGIGYSWEFIQIPQIRDHNFEQIIYYRYLFKFMQG